ncbi:unnamed protein product, partial [Caretta caretta]
CPADGMSCVIRELQYQQLGRHHPGLLIPFDLIQVFFLENKVDTAHPTEDVTSPFTEKMSPDQEKRHGDRPGKTLTPLLFCSLTGETSGY